MTPRITICRNREGFEVMLNEAGRDLLVRALLMLSRENDHFHLAPEEFALDVPAREVAYREGDEVMAWGKVNLRPDDWDAEFSPHVLADV